MRASVRMTRYLESWGAAKPFAHLHHRDSMTTENGKISTTVCPLVFQNILALSEGLSPNQKALPVQITSNEVSLPSLTSQRPLKIAIRI